MAGAKCFTTIMRNIFDAPASRGIACQEQIAMPCLGLNFMVRIRNGLISWHLIEDILQGRWFMAGNFMILFLAQCSDASPDLVKSCLGMAPVK